MALLLLSTGMSVRPASLVAGPIPGPGVWRPAAPPPGIVAPDNAAPFTDMSAGAALLADGTVLIRDGRYDPATDTWRALTPPEAIGVGATLSRLADGRVLFAGGWWYGAPFGPQPGSAAIYAPATNAWTTVAAPASTRVGHTATTLADGRVLVVGGEFSPTTAEVFDPATGFWTATGPLAVGRTSHTATRLADGRVLVTGGRGGNGTALPDAEVYDPATNLWLPVASLRSARADHTATLLADGRVLVVGGVAPTGIVGTAERFDPATGNWSEIAAPSVPRARHAATLLADGTVLIVGGVVPGGPSASAERYDPVAGTWRPTFGVRAKAALPTLVALADGSALLLRAGYADRFDPAAPVPSFSDMPTGGLAYEAITNLAARGLVRGYGDGTFGRDDPLLRAQIAAILMRAMAWERESYANPFTDQGATDDELWRAVATLAHYRVAQGYGDGTYNPTGPVLKVQVVSLVTRAQLARGYWTPLAVTGTPYPNVPESSGARYDLAQFVAHAGPVPDTSDQFSAWADWDQPATRGWTALVLWQAFNSPGGAAR